MTLFFFAPGRDLFRREGVDRVAELAAHLDLFAVGARVRHPIMGPGTVVAVDEDKGAHVVQFDGAATPRAISFKARLEAE